MAKVNTNILEISDYNGLEWVNLIQMTTISTTAGKNPLEEVSRPQSQQKGPKHCNWVQSQK